MRIARFLAALVWSALLLAGCAASQAEGGAAPRAAAPAGGDKRIALSFDDVPRGPGAFFTPDERAARIVAGLRAARVDQAAFFLNPGHLDRPEGAGGEARIARYVAAGHVIANHSATHPDLSATEAAAYLADIDAAEAWLRDRPGRRPWFRFPFLDEGREDKAKRDAVRAGLAARGLANGYATADASDWHLEKLAVEAGAAGQAMDMAALGRLYVQSHVEAADFYDALARRALGRAPAQVMLMHETDLAALFLPDLVAALRADGWTIVTADEAYRDPVAAMAATIDVPSAQGTLVEAIAWSRGLPEPRWWPGNAEPVAKARFAREVLGAR